MGGVINSPISQTKPTTTTVTGSSVTQNTPLTPSANNTTKKTTAFKPASNVAITFSPGNRTNASSFQSGVYNSPSLSSLVTPNCSSTQKVSGHLFQRTASAVSSSSLKTVFSSIPERRSSSVSRLPQRSTPLRQSGREIKASNCVTSPSTTTVAKSKIPSSFNNNSSSSIPTAFQETSSNDYHSRHRRISLQGREESVQNQSQLRRSREEEVRKKYPLQQQQQLPLNDHRMHRRGSDQMPSSSITAFLSKQTSSPSAEVNQKSTVQDLKCKLLESVTDASDVMKRNQVSTSMTTVKTSNNDNVMSGTTSSSVSSSHPTSFSRRGSVINSNSISNNNYWIPYRKEAAPGTFLARDNVCNFISWCRSLGIRDCLLFESDDLVLGKNEKSFILCLLEVARKGSMVGMKIPLLIQMEQEIDQEIMNMNHDIMGMTCLEEKKNQDDLKDHDSQYNSDSDASSSNCFNSIPQAQIVTNDLRSLHEHVVDLLNRCTCPSQYPMIKVADGKYRIGDTKTLIFVRILRKHVMVRVGGGWDTLEHYLDKHDPCRCYYSSTASSAGGGIAAGIGGSFRRRSSMTNTSNTSFQSNPFLSHSNSSNTVFTIVRNRQS